MARTVKLPSGMELMIGETPFSESNALFKAVIKSLRMVEVDNTIHGLDEFIGALLGAQLSDGEVEKAMWDCLKYATYGDRKIVSSLFDEEKARTDYIDICLEVGQENLRPFMKGLYAALPRLTSAILSLRKSK